MLKIIYDFLAQDYSGESNDRHKPIEKAGYENIISVLGGFNIVLHFSTEIRFTGLVVGNDWGRSIVPVSLVSES